MKPVVVFYKPSSATVDNKPQSAPQRGAAQTALQQQLHTAAKRNDAEALLQLVRQGANLTQLHSKGNTLFHTAAYHGSVDFIQELVAALPDQDAHRMMNRANEYGSTPLHSAAKKGHVKAIKLLLDLGAEPNVRDHQKRTPLDLAIKSRHTRAAQVFQNPREVSDVFVSSSTPSGSSEALSAGMARGGASKAALFPKRFSSGLNPFAQSFSPRRVAHQVSDPDLQLPAESELLAPEAFYQVEQTMASESTRTESEPGSFPASPVQSGRLNIFTGQWGDPFLPQQAEEVVLKGLSILNRINTKCPLEGVSLFSQSISLNSEHFAPFIRPSEEPFTPVERPEGEKRRPFIAEGI
ncbi:ankyrin repeat domain-containing protein [Vampirovibrio chlorellavorus]|uniref:ankyrin repeat domain-containing protein n=1 Tax=Vampirovibrio chlorellavorus TaxID=758823 RepID=UPI0026F21583|nr:ankyrin repeat domain-containing protein [Vampirovibrio chlorellavorus]